MIARETIHEIVMWGNLLSLAVGWLARHFQISVSVKSKNTKEDKEE